MDVREELKRQRLNSALQAVVWFGIMVLNIPDIIRDWSAGPRISDCGLVIAGIGLTILNSVIFCKVSKQIKELD